MNINGKEWKPFYIVDIFNVKNTASILAKDIIPNSGKISYVTASALNNGIAEYISFDSNYVDEGNSIFIGGKTLVITWQENDYVSNDSHNLSLIIKDPKGRTKYSQLFMVTALYRSLKDVYKWSDSISKKSIQKDIVYLPVNTNDTPDFLYMENYMKDIEKSVNNRINELQQKVSYQKINSSNWKPFIVKNLFSIDKPIARSKNDYEKGTFPFVASGNFNNGIECFVCKKNENDFDKGNCITVSPLDGSAFYQENDFLGRGGAGSSIFILRNENINKYNALFLCSVIRKICSKYSYNDMINQEKMKNEVLSLPALDDNTPDWLYMENFIKSKIDNISERINNLTTII